MRSRGDLVVRLKILEIGILSGHTFTSFEMIPGRSAEYQVPKK
jgi:hypothetical protein